MGPVLLCDKSAIQTLQAAAPQLLHHYFWVNLPPVLVIEILGDLAKTENRDLDQDRVQRLAQRLGHTSVIPNESCDDLIHTELTGTPVEMRGRPIVAEREQAIAPNGEIVTRIGENPHELALLKWRNGEFAQAEAVLAEVWRHYKSSLHWQDTLVDLQPHYSTSMKAKTTLDETLTFVDDLLVATQPRYLLAWLLKDLGFPPPTISNLMQNFSGSNSNNWKAFPYTQYCLRTSLFAHFSMAFKLISQKADNRIDLEYLLYLPFCDIFTSQDRFHRKLAPYLLTKDQVFVPYDELASGLQSISHYLNTLSPEQRTDELQQIGPPQIDTSIVYRLWVNFMKPNYRSKPRLRLSPQQEKNLANQVMMLMAAKPRENDGSDHRTSESDPVVRTLKISGRDPCPCRSGKLFWECHGQNPGSKNDHPAT